LNRIRRVTYAAALAALFVGGIPTGAPGSPIAAHDGSTLRALSALYTLEDGFQPRRTVTVSTPSALRRALASLRQRELLDVRAGSYPGAYEFRTAVRACCAKIKFEPGVRFTGSAVVGHSGTVYAIHVTGSNLILWGPADVSNPNWDGIRVEGASNVVIGGGIRTHDNGNQGFLIQQNYSTLSQNVWLDGLESTNNGTAAASELDGVGSYYQSGDHGIFWGEGTTGGGIVNSYVHDQPNGYCLQVYGGDGAGSGSLFAFDTFARCTSLGDGSHPRGMGIYDYDGGPDQTFVANVFVGSRQAGLGSGLANGAAHGSVFYDNGQDVYQDASPWLTVHGSHHVNPLLDAGDRPHAGSPLKNLAARYRNYLPRTDFAGNARTTADPGAFIVPSP
jgi:hypothetical protein